MIDSIACPFFAMGIGDLMGSMSLGLSFLSG